MNTPTNAGLEGPVKTFVGDDVLNRIDAFDVEVYNSTDFSKPNP